MAFRIFLVHTTYREKGKRRETETDPGEDHFGKARIRDWKYYVVYRRYDDGVQVA